MFMRKSHDTTNHHKFLISFTHSIIEFKLSKDNFVRNIAKYIILIEVNFQTMLCCFMQCLSIWLRCTCKEMPNVCEHLESPSLVRYHLITPWIHTSGKVIWYTSHYILGVNCHFGVLVWFTETTFLLVAWCKSTQII